MISGRSHPRTRTGLSILEVVFAMALLGLVAVAASAAVSFIFKSQSREARSLAAAELGNRIILMYLDDPQSPDTEGDKITWSTGETYRWSIDRSEVAFTPAVEPKEASSAGVENTNRVPPSSGAANNLERLHVVRVRVWLSEDNGGSFSYSPAIANASLSRLIDPMEAVSRPDSSRRLIRKYGASGASEYIRTGNLREWGSGGGGSSGSSSAGGSRSTSGGSK